MGNRESVPVSGPESASGLQYEKLSKNQIRLLKFKRRRRRDPQYLNMSLHTVSLSESPRYHCLLMSGENLTSSGPSMSMEPWPILPATSERRSVS